MLSNATTPATEQPPVTLPEVIEQVGGIQTQLAAHHEAMPGPKASYANMPCWYVGQALDALTLATELLKKANDLTKNKPALPC